MTAAENEKRVHEFYDATAPGHRERLFTLQAAHVVYEMQDGLPAGGGRFEGLPDVGDRFLPSFYGAFDVRFLPEEFVAQGESVVAIGRIRGRTREGGVPVDVPFVHIWTVQDDVLVRLRAFTDTALLVRALDAPTSVASAASPSA